MAVSAGRGSRPLSVRKPRCGFRVGLAGSAATGSTASAVAAASATGSQSRGARAGRFRRPSRLIASARPASRSRRRASSTATIPHLPSRRHARQQPSRLGAVRGLRRLWRPGDRRTVAASLLRQRQPQLSGRRSATARRRPADARGACRPPRSATTRCSAPSRTNERLQGARHRLFRRHRPGPRAAAPRLSASGGPLGRRSPPISPCATTISALRGRDHPARVGGWSGPAGGVTLSGSYGEGIAQPTFFDLFGFFPGCFVGNPALRPETSRGGEAGCAGRTARRRAALTGFASRLSNEIVDDLRSHLPLRHRQRRRARAGARGSRPASWRHAVRLHLERELHLARRERASASPAAAQYASCGGRGSTAILPPDGKRGRLTWGATSPMSAARRDTDFDLFPARGAG